MSWFDQVIMELARPDDQGLDWYGWVTNQLSHCFVGLFLTAVSFLYLQWPPLLLILLVATGKEGYDLYNGGDLKDSINDWLFMIIGGFLCNGLYTKETETIALALGASLAGIIMGIIPRIKNM